MNGGIFMEEQKIKDIAKGARARLKSGYWNDVKKTREETICLAIHQGRDVVSTNNIFSQKLEKQINSTASTFIKEDEEFYKKVCRLLDKNGDVFNPISQLIDEKAIAGLNEQAKQSYILKLAEKFKAMRERYFCEHQLKTNFGY